ncbi:MAG: cysteine--tRNA ligase [Rhodospirillales bacterium]|nr:cysteine--tRNA ligase [Rhodospirillales bacterium]MCB9965389.1 cysteine--tRNA ligase [Rhodospirillales bacterium]MCB9973284.1 cysteine--tRNA ligase [Rhodospirillales bacterium]MCB9980606.1 cysteine--tRNA ligase [Rhodospirillales bacterium]
MIKLFNSATRQIEPFIPIHGNKVGLYACGPTVYNYAHIGNMRAYLFEDTLQRTLRHCGYDVTFVMNITDVGHLQSDADEGDDKMALAAKREQKSPWDIARFYEEAFFRHTKMLNIQRPDIVARATEHIPEMIAMVKTLQDKGYAYESEGNVYFDVAKFPDYAAFARLKMNDQQATGRVEFDSRKQNQADFALWFSQSKFPNQIMKWDSPWGEGFPGWHIECSAMASKYLGEHIDIHCGGIDHIPVHHTNEIAQAECCFDHKWVNVWMHGAFLTVDDGKMSKSKGDFLTVDKLRADGFHPLAYRYFILSAHYRNELRFDYDILTAAQKAYQGLYEKVQEWQVAPEAPTNSPATQSYADEFWAALREDLHTPTALTVVWKVVKDETLSTGDKLALLTEFDTLLGLRLTPEVIPLSSAEETLITERGQARTDKNWAESDRLRDLLLKEHNIQVKDTARGMIWVRVLPPIEGES